MFVSCKALLSSVVWLLLESNKPEDGKKNERLKSRTGNAKTNKELTGTLAKVTK